MGPRVCSRGRYDGITRAVSGLRRAASSDVLLNLLFVRTGEEERAGEATPVKMGEAMDGLAPKKRHPITTVAAAPRNTSGIAVGNDKRNGRGRRAAGK